MQDHAGGAPLTPGERENVYRTTDLPLMAWYLMHGIELVKVERQGNGNCWFVFSDPEDRTERLQIEYANSPMRTFDECVRMLRKLTNEMRRKKK